MEQFFTFVLDQWLLWAGMLIALFLLIAYEFSARYGGAQKLTPQQVVQLMNHGNAVVFDVREAKKFDEGHIQGAQNITLKAITDEAKEVKRHKGKPIIIVWDLIMTPAAQAAKSLLERGYESCHIMQGGMSAWIDASLPVVKDKQPSKKAAKKQRKS